MVQNPLRSWSFFGEINRGSEDVVDFLRPTPGSTIVRVMYAYMYACMHVCVYVRMGAGLADNVALVLVGHDYSRVVENEHNLFINTWMCSLLGFAASGWRNFGAILQSGQGRLRRREIQE